MGIKYSTIIPVLAAVLKCDKVVGKITQLFQIKYI